MQLLDPRLLVNIEEFLLSDFIHNGTRGSESPRVKATAPEDLKQRITELASLLLNCLSRFIITGHMC